MNDRLTRSTLPIDEILPQLCAAVSSGIPVVLKAPPGAGKTTRVPLALLTDCGIDDQQIWVVQPRRLAARSVAEFLSRSLGERIGKTIGYHVRLDRRESASTRVMLMTTGMFLRRMQSDPLLERVGCVVFDEFHERSIDLDLSLALTQRLRTELRNELRLIVMSATLDPRPIAEYLGKDAVSLKCEGRSFAVDIVYHDMSRRIDSRRPAAVEFERISQVISLAVTQTTGHVLVFLPGLAEIHRVRSALQSVPLPMGTSILALHGSLSPQEQDAAIRGGGNVRKIILSTNIAETSVTVEGVTAVVDSGLAKIAVLDSRLGLTRLQTEPISIASADQRAGRAGRTAPGVAHRMWSAVAHRTRETYDRPEILRGDLSATALTLANLGEQVDDSLDWLTPPPEHSLQAAMQRLKLLDAVDDDGRITELGHELAALPLDPRVARFAVAALRYLPATQVAFAAATLSEPISLERMPPEFDQMSLPDKSVWVIHHEQSIPVRFRSVVQQIARAVAAITPHAAQERLSAGEAISRALLAAYPDRVVMRRGSDPDRGVMVGRRGVVGLISLPHLDRSTEFLLCYDTDGSSTQSRVRGAIAINPSWLDPKHIDQVLEVDFDSERECVICRQRRRYLDLVLSETPTACQDSESTASRLFEEASRNPKRVVPDDSPTDENNFAACMSRIDLVFTHSRDAGPSTLPTRENLWSEVCRELCHGRRSFQDLRLAPWKDHLIGRLGYDVWQRVQSEAPTHLMLPSGNRVKIGYAEGRPPWIEAKIQECFGWQTTPRILGGRVPLLLHLLGPNRRPQQITDDLESFWRSTYSEIRKELRRRYPKHYWPEDPTTAQATRNGLQPK